MTFFHLVGWTSYFFKRNRLNVQKGNNLGNIHQISTHSFIDKGIILTVSLSLHWMQQWLMNSVMNVECCIHYLLKIRMKSIIKISYVGRHLFFFIMKKMAKLLWHKRTLKNYFEWLALVFCASIFTNCRYNFLRMLHNHKLLYMPICSMLKL